MASLRDEVLSMIRRERLLDGVRTLVVAVSGGADSVCLLDLLADMAKAGDIGVALHVAHLNHALRGAESDEDERFVRGLAARYGLPATVERRDLRAIQAEGGGSLEEAARRERYEFLGSAARDVAAQAIAVAHNADDQVETVLHRLIRGAGLRGLCGMAVSRPLGRGASARLIRPLLAARRAGILEYLRGRGLAFREDSSNRDTVFLRNRIRHELIPFLESGYGRAFGESVLRLSRSVSEAYDLIQGLAESAGGECVTGGALDVEKFRALHEALRPLVIGRALEAAAPDAPALEARHYQAVVDLALDGERGAEVHLPGGLVARRTEKAVTFGPPAQEPAPLPDEEVALVVPGETDARRLGMVVRAEVFDGGAFDLESFVRAKTRYDEAMDYDALAMPLVLRPRREGDRFQPLGAPGRKKVGDFLTDLKVPESERRELLVLADAVGPVWLVGWRIDERVKVARQTRRLLRLSAQPLEQAPEREER